MIKLLLPLLFNPPSHHDIYPLSRLGVWDIHCASLACFQISFAFGRIEKSIKVFRYISNKMQRYTVYFIWKLLYMFRVIPPPIIRSANNCIYSIWYLSHRYCYLPLAADSSKPEAAAAAAVDRLLMTGKRMPETCWAVFKRQAINL
jgi:hypothetical protein